MVRETRTPGDSGAYTDIDETVLDDNDMLKSGTAGQDFNCTLSDWPAGDFDIAGVKIRSSSEGSERTLEAGARCEDGRHGAAGCTVILLLLP